MTLQLSSQVTDIGFDYVGVSSKVVVPNVVQDLGFGQHMPGSRKEET
jgi:hypothetical protein